MFISMISITVNPDLETSTFFGLAINYTLLIPIYLTWVVKFSNDLEVYMGAVERISSFANIPTDNYSTESKEQNVSNLALKLNSHSRS